jgi:hypothetical protein
LKVFKVFPRLFHIIRSYPRTGLVLGMADVVGAVFGGIGVALQIIGMGIDIANQQSGISLHI